MIGFRTLVQLLEKGYNVRAAARNQSGFDRIAALPQAAKYRQQLTSVIVPDITVPGAYDEAVQGVKYVVHVASPLAGKNAGTDYEKLLIQPAVQGTVGMLEAATKAPGIKRVVITASIVALSPAALKGGDEIITGTFLQSACPFQLS